MVRGGSRWTQPVVVLIGVLVVLTAAGGATVALVGRDDAPAGPAARPSPTPVAAPSRAPLLPALPDAPVPSAAGLATVLARALQDPALGGRIAAAVVDVATGDVLVDRRGTTPVTPASTAKIATAVAALSALDPEARLPTRVLAGALPGEVVLVGGGDATLVADLPRPGYPRRAQLSDLAAQVRTALAGAPVTRILVDGTAYAAPLTGPAWRPTYVTGGDVAPTSALMVDGGRVSENGPRAAEPDLLAGRALARALGAPAAPVATGVAGEGAVELGVVRSPTVRQLVEVLLTRSDNDVGESLARQVAVAQGEPPTFEGAAAAVARVLAEITPDTDATAFALTDGSGLSRSSRLQPLALARLIAEVAQDDDRDDRFGPVLAGLPVAGFDGTLTRRYREGPSATAAGVVRGKTGTLNGVSALAGLLRTRDGRVLAFDLTADAVPPGANRAAEEALDRLAAALASCGCP